MQRIYLPNTQLSEYLVITQRELYHQLTRVMRARVGQKYIFFDGIHLQDHVYEISDINKDSCSFNKLETKNKLSEGECNVTLFQAFPNKLSKFEVIVQKCSEVGYKKIVFFESERSQKIVISDNKKQRLEKIAIEAIELCGGNIIPSIEYRSQLGDIGPAMSLVCHTQDTDSIRLCEGEYNQDLQIIVGPEGGFSNQEIENMDAKKVYLGNRILRCETVGEVVGFYINQL